MKLKKFNQLFEREGFDYIDGYDDDDYEDEGYDKLNSDDDDSDEEAEDHEIVPVSDLEKRLEQAISKEKYREAVRIYFTLILKELIRLNQIKWTREKTNHEYLIGLKNPNFRSEFQSCIHVFDVIWYGEYEIDNSRFNEVEPTLKSFLNTLKAHE